MHLRLRRRPKMLVANELPGIYPKSIAVVEQALAKHKQLKATAVAYPVRLIPLTLDLWRAMLLSKWLGIMRRSRVRGL
jgi:hypothetical protein